jgi:predicted nucleotidyltransferase
MLKNQTVNLKVIEKVALALGDINDEVIYIGGAVVGLYVTDKGADLPRPTKDIDISVQVSTYSEMEQLRIKLAAKGIHPAVNETVMYRYSYDDILIDFIPYEDTPLGPTNRWLKPGFNKAYSVPVGKAVIKCCLSVFSWQPNGRLLKTEAMIQELLLILKISSMF